MVKNQVYSINSCVPVNKNLKTGSKIVESNQNKMGATSSSIPKEAKSVLFSKKNNLIAMETNVIDTDKIERLSKYSVLSFLYDLDRYYYGDCDPENWTHIDPELLPARHISIKRITDYIHPDAKKELKDIKNASSKKIEKFIEKMAKERLYIYKVEGNKVYLKGSRIYNVNSENNTYQTGRETIIITKLDNEGGSEPNYLIEDIVFEQVK